MVSTAGPSSSVRKALFQEGKAHDRHDPMIIFDDELTTLSNDLNGLPSSTQSLRVIGMNEFSDVKMTQLAEVVTRKNFPYLTRLELMIRGYTDSTSWEKLFLSIGSQLTELYIPQEGLIVEPNIDFLLMALSLHCPEIEVINMTLPIKEGTLGILYRLDCLEQVHVTRSPYSDLSIHTLVNYLKSAFETSAHLKTFVMMSAFELSEEEGIAFVELAEFCNQNNICFECDPETGEVYMERVPQEDIMEVVDVQPMEIDVQEVGVQNDEESEGSTYLYETASCGSDLGTKEDLEGSR